MYMGLYGTQLRVLILFGKVGRASPVFRRLGAGAALNGRGEGFKRCGAGVCEEFGR